MGLEAATKISELNALNPTETDQVSFGDDHTRLLKQVLLNEIAGTGDIADLINSIIDGRLADQYPVGSLYISTASTDPGDFIPGTTWAAYGEGRALVGVGTADGKTWAAGETDGEAEHTLVWDTIPSHSHACDPPSQTFTTSSNGSHDHGIRGAENTTGGSTDAIFYRGDWQSGSVTNKSGLVNASGSHNHTVSVNLSAFQSNMSGGGNAHNNIQPSIAVYMWTRTA